jgi:predicted acyltransferase
LLLWVGVSGAAILMPINKSLWTPSYCFLVKGWALLIFSAFFWLLDVNPYGAVRAAVPDLRHECAVHLRVLGPGSEVKV